MLLLIDIGNTRIKWAYLRDGRLGEHAAAAREGLTDEALRVALVRTPEPPSRVLVSNVAGAQAGELVSSCIKRAWNRDAEFVHSAAQACGVRSAYRDPGKLGVDRWLAIIAAHAAHNRPACIVSVGTAMTIDGVDRRGLHLGGVITPGPDLMASSLFSNTSDIAQRAQQGASTDALFADNTLGAVEQGATHALAALVERAVDVMQAQLGEAPVLIFTGGASSRVQPAVRRPGVVVPDLVLRGLAVFSGEPFFAAGEVMGSSD